MSDLCSLCLTFCSFFVVFCSLLVKFVHTHFCCLSMSISLLGCAPSFLGQIFHDIIIVAPSLSFLNVLKSCCLVLFSWRKLQKTTKNTVLRKIFYVISPQQDCFRTWFEQIPVATVQGYNFHFLTIFGNGHVTNHPDTPLNRPWQVSSCFSLLFGQTRWNFLFRAYAQDPDMDPESSA